MFCRILSSVLIFVCGVSFAGSRMNPGSRGVFLQDRHRTFYQVIEKVDEDPGILDIHGRPIFPKGPQYVILPTRIGLEHATPGGQTFYPMALSGTYDKIPERDPVSGEEFGPAGYASRWEPHTKTLSTNYSNGFYTRENFQIQAPDFIPGLEDAWTDSYSNVFWISRSLGGETRIFHENALNRNVPLNELVFGEKVRKVRGAPSGKGLVILLESGQVLEVRVPEDFSLHVTRVNDPSEFRVVDLESGPLGVDPFEFSLVLLGAGGKGGRLGVRVHQAGKIRTAHPVPLRYMDPFQRIIEVDFVEGMYGNVHEVELARLLDRHPSELNRFLQAHFELRQEEIGLLVRKSNSPDFLPRLMSHRGIGRRVILDERAPGLCRYYMMSHYGLSPDLYLN